MAKRGGLQQRAKHASGTSGGTGAPAIPDKLYFRIGEVARLCQVPSYVLRFWQTEFPQLRPGKSGTGQRLYRRRDVEMALRIKCLLHEEGYTIAGAKGVLTAEPAPAKLQPELPLPAMPGQEQATTQARLQMVRGELRELLGLLQRRPASRPAEFTTQKLFSSRDQRPGD